MIPGADGKAADRPLQICPQGKAACLRAEGRHRPLQGQKTPDPIMIFGYASVANCSKASAKDFMAAS